MQFFINQSVSIEYSILYRRTLKIRFFTHHDVVTQMSYPRSTGHWTAECISIAFPNILFVFFFLCFLLIKCHKRHRHYGSSLWECLYRIDRSFSVQPFRVSLKNKNKMRKKSQFPRTVALFQCAVTRMQSAARCVCTTPRRRSIGVWCLWRSFPFFFVWRNLSSPRVIRLHIWLILCNVICPFTA